MAKSFPDLTGDGQVTRADVLKGRGVFRHGGRVKKMAVGGAVNKENPSMHKGAPIKPFTKGPQGPRRYPGQNEAARKRREMEQALKDKEMSKKMNEAYERFERSSESDSPGYKKGGSVKSSASRRADGIAKKGKTRGKFV